MVHLRYQISYLFTRLKYILAISVFSMLKTATYSQYSFTNYTIDDGLMTDNVTCTYRDSRGFLWVGSRSGLQVFNGKYFRNIKHHLLDSNSLSGDWVMSITEDKNGFIWAGTDKGICRIHPGHLECRRYEPGSNLPANINPSYSRLITGPSGNIYALTSNGLLELIGEQFRVLREINNTGGISFGRNNHLLYTYSGTVVERDILSGKEFFPSLDHDKKSQHTSIYQDVNGNYWLGTWAEGLFHYDSQWKDPQNFKWDLHPMNPSTTNIINHITGDSQFVYVSSFNGIYIYDIRRPVDLQKPDLHIVPDPNFSHGISTSMISHIYIDKNDNMWVSTPEGLHVNLAISREYKRKSANVGFTTDLIWYNGQLISSSWYGKGLYFFDPNLEPIKTVQYLPEYQNELDNSQISGLDVDQNGDLWVATFNGLAQFDLVKNKTLNYITHEKNQIATNRLNDVWINQKDHSVWMANYNHGISIYYPASGLTENLSTSNHPAIVNNLVWDFYDDKKENVWILTNSGVIRYNYQQQHWKSWTYTMVGDQKVEMSRINSLLCDSRGIVWMGTENGLFLLIKDHWYFKGIEHGLPERTVNGIVEDNSGNIWLSFPHTILHYDPKTLATAVLSSRNGIILPEIHSIFKNPITDQLFLITDNHFYELNKTNILKTRTTSPVVYLEDFKVNNHSYYQRGDSFTIEKNIFSYDQNNIEMVFNTPVIGEIGSLCYTYRIGSNEFWSTPSDNNRIILPELQPGNYKLEIKSSTDRTHWSNDPLKLELIIQPPFWATWWFRMLMVTTIVLILIWTVRFISTRNLKLKILRLEKDQAIEKERSRLSRDMHDDLGSGLTKISILSEVIKKKIPQDEKLTEYLDNISGSSRELVQNLNNIIWSLNPGNDTWNALIAYIREYAANFLEGCQVEFEFKGPIQIPDLEVSEPVKRNIFLVVKETLNNSVKHGKASKIILQLEKTGVRSFTITVTDNGSGIKLPDSKGNGLKNMEKRMTEIGGKWTIEFIENKGTTTTLQYSF